MPTSRSMSPFQLARWSEEDARQVLDALARSGQPVSAFAAEHGLDPQRVYLWRRRLGTSAERTTFREVVVRAEGSDRFEIVLRSGTTVRVPTGFDDDSLERLLAALLRVGAC